MVEIQAAKKIAVQLVTKELYHGSGPRGVDLYARNLYEELSLVYTHDQFFIGPLANERTNLDLVHYTFFDPFFLTLQAGGPVKHCVVTVHDLIPLKFPTHFPAGLKGRCKWIIQKHLLRHVDGIITDSESSAKDIKDIVGYPREQIFVIPLSAPHTTITADLARTVQKEYQLPERYILYVGDINWNKNVTGLIEAFGTLKDPEIHLVLVGKAFVKGRGTPEFAAIEAAIAKCPNAGQIHLLGFLPSHHLPAIYHLATLYVQPSWYEGFGFPLLEGMLQDCPVLSSSAGSLPEVGGEFVHYFDPNHQGELASKLRDLMSNINTRTLFIESGRKWAKTFTWKKAAQATHEVYEKILG